VYTAVLCHSCLLTDSQLLHVIHDDDDSAVCMTCSHSFSALSLAVDTSSVNIIYCEPAVNVSLLCIMQHLCINFCELFFPAELRQFT